MAKRGQTTRHSHRNSVEMQPEAVLVLYQDIKFKNEEAIKSALAICLSEYYKEDEKLVDFIPDTIKEIFKGAREIQDDIWEVRAPLFASTKEQDGYQYVRKSFTKYYYKPFPEQCNGIFDASAIKEDEGFEENNDSSVSELAKCDTIIDKISTSEIFIDPNKSFDEEDSNSQNTVEKIIVAKSLVDELLDARQEEKNFWMDLRAASKQSGNAASLERRIKDLNNKIATRDEKITSLSQDKKNAEDGKQDAERKKDEAIRDKEAVVKERNRIKGLLDAEISAHSATKSALDEQVQQNKELQVHMQKYTEQLLIMPQTVIEFAKKCNTFFEEYKALVNDATKMVGSSKKGIADDDYNYYYMRIMNKFAKSTSSISNLSTYLEEIGSLANTGMVFTNGIVTKDIKNKDIKVSTLETLYYSRIFKTLASAAIIMSDEFAYMLPKMADQGCPDTNVFAKHTEKLIKAIGNIGYKIKYSRPFTKVDSFAQVVEFTQADIQSGQVFEVVELAIDYGTSNLVTKVIAKE